MTEVVCVRGARGQIVPTAREQEIIDRFGELLNMRAAVSARVRDGRYEPGQLLPPWQRYALRLCSWRMANVTAEGE